jgi:hypothetical protein
VIEGVIDVGVESVYRQQVVILWLGKPYELHNGGFDVV